MKIFFVTSNKHKAEEVKKVMEKYSIEIEHIDYEYDEPQDVDINEVSLRAAKSLAEKLGKPVCVDDTGIFFEAYPNFPGLVSKFIFYTIGYEGIFRLLSGKSKKAYFKTAAGYCEPGKEPLVFEGFMHGSIIDDVRNPEADCMPYNRIFIPEGETRTLSSMTEQEKLSFLQRTKAFSKLAEFLVSGKK